MAFLVHQHDNEDITLKKCWELWKKRLGYYSSDIQKQKTVDLESAVNYEWPIKNLVSLDLRSKEDKAKRPCPKFLKTGPAVLKDTQDVERKGYT